MKNITIQVIKDGKVRLTVPHGLLKWEGEYPLAQQSGTYVPFISRAACESAGLDPKTVQADFIAGRRTIKTDSGLCLKFGVNPDGTILADQAVEEAKRAEEYARKADAEKRLKYASQIEEAARSGQNVEISTKRWSETRRAKEGGEWGDYMFICSRTEWVTPAGEFKSKEVATNTY